MNEQYVFNPGVYRVGSYSKIIHRDYLEVIDNSQEVETLGNKLEFLCINDFCDILAMNSTRRIDMPSMMTLGDRNFAIIPQWMENDSNDEGFVLKSDSAFSVTVNNLSIEIRMIDVVIFIDGNNFNY